jgi:methylglutaconyl-CoA hydratase
MRLTMSEATILTQIDDRGVAVLTMNRPEVHNAFDDHFIAALTQTLASLDSDAAVRVVQLAASGSSFSAGADLDWMKRMAAYSREENLADAHGLAELMRRLNSLSKPTIALVQGAAYGGGVGLVACCDIVLATRRASFCLSETKLGLIPAVISPYVMAAIGESACRRYFLTAEPFEAAEARRLGLVHEVLENEEMLAATAEKITCKLLRNGPQALAAAKELIAMVAAQPPGEALLAATAELIAERRASAEGREGVAAFLEKRKSAWIAD